MTDRPDDGGPAFDPNPKPYKEWRPNPLGTFYRLYLYRHHMRLLHRFGLHWFTRLWPDGQPQKWCRWCGERHIIIPASADAMLAERRKRFGS